MAHGTLKCRWAKEEKEFLSAFCHGNAEVGAYATHCMISLANDIRVVFGQLLIYKSPLSTRKVAAIPIRTSLGHPSRGYNLMDSLHKLSEKTLHDANRNNSTIYSLICQNHLATGENLTTHTKRSPKGLIDGA